MKYWETEHSLPLPWYQVTRDKIATFKTGHLTHLTLHTNIPLHQASAGYWYRYPNPHSTHVTALDTLECTAEGGNLYAKGPNRNIDRPSLSYGN